MAAEPAKFQAQLGHALAGLGHQQLGDVALRPRLGAGDRAGDPAQIEQPQRVRLGDDLTRPTQVVGGAFRREHCRAA